MDQLLKTGSSCFGDDGKGELPLKQHLDKAWRVHTTHRHLAFEEEEPVEEHFEADRTQQE